MHREATGGSVSRTRGQKILHVCAMARDTQDGDMRESRGAGRWVAIKEENLLLRKG